MTLAARVILSDFALRLSEDDWFIWKLPAMQGFLQNTETSFFKRPEYEGVSAALLSKREHGVAHVDLDVAKDSQSTLSTDKQVIKGSAPI